MEPNEILAELERLQQVALEVGAQLTAIQERLATVDTKLLRGPKGDRGEIGPEGRQGRTGPPGMDGANGRDGKDGATIIREVKISG